MGGVNLRGHEPCAGPRVLGPRVAHCRRDRPWRMRLSLTGPCQGFHVPCHVPCPAHSSIFAMTTTSQGMSGVWSHQDLRVRSYWLRTLVARVSRLIDSSHEYNTQYGVFCAWRSVLGWHPRGVSRFPLPAEPAKKPPLPHLNRTCIRFQRERGAYIVLFAVRISRCVLHRRLPPPLRDFTELRAV